MQWVLFFFVHSRSRTGWLVECKSRWDTPALLCPPPNKEHTPPNLLIHILHYSQNHWHSLSHTVSWAQVIITHSNVRERQADRPFSSLNRGDASRHQQRSGTSANRRLLCAELVFSVREPCSTAIPHPTQHTTLPNSQHCCAICQVSFIHLKVIGANVWLKRSLFFRGGGENRGRW